MGIDFCHHRAGIGTGNIWRFREWWGQRWRDFPDSVAILPVRLVDSAGDPEFALGKRSRTGQWGPSESLVVRNWLGWAFGPLGFLLRLDSIIR